MVEAILDVLNPRAGQTFVDGTLGGGGHTEALLVASEPSGTVLGIDRDPDALDEARRRLARFGDRFVPVRANYSQIPDVLAERGVDRVDGLLIDAGVSSHQLDDAARGFSFQRSGPLDMRMSQSGESLEEMLDRLTERELERILRVWGESRESRRLARAIVEARDQGALTDTASLRPRDRARLQARQKARRDPPRHAGLPGAEDRRQ